MDSTTNFKTTAEWLYEAAGHMCSPAYQTRVKKNSYDSDLDYPIFKKISTILKEFLANTPKELLNKKTCSSSAVSILQSNLEKMGNKQATKMNVDKIKVMADLLKAAAAVADQVDDTAYAQHLGNNPDKVLAIHIEAVATFKARETAQEKEKRKLQLNRIEELLGFMVEGMQGVGLTAPEAVDELEANKKIADWIRANNLMEPDKPQIKFADIEMFGIDRVLTAMQLKITKEESKFDADVDATTYKNAQRTKETRLALNQAKIEHIRAADRSPAEASAQRQNMLNRHLNAQDFENQLHRMYRKQYLAERASRTHYTDKPEISRTRTSVSLSVISTSSTSSVGSDEGSQQSSGVMRTDSTESVPSIILSPKIKSPAAKSPAGGAHLKSPKGISK